MNPKYNRRYFVRLLSRLGMNAALAPVIIKAVDLFGQQYRRRPFYGQNAKIKSINADYFRSIPDSKQVQCTLCPRNEILNSGETGFCRVRKNKNGKLITYGYNQPCVLNLDPIEKNPLCHFYPDMQVISIAHAGCNLRCLYCQNWQYSQKSPTQTRNINDYNSNNIIKRMKKKEIKGISFTYTEGVNCPEFLKEFAALCGEFQLKRTLCTAGFVNKKPLWDMIKYLDAVTITYKGASEEFYRKIIGGRLKTVQDSMLIIKNEGKWLEIATLVVPTINDDIKSLKSITSWIRDNLGEDTPWHIEKFNPQYKLIKLPPTSQKTLETARKIGLDAGLKFVYISNLAPHAANHTYCQNCGKILIKRLGFKVLHNYLDGNTCYNCQTLVPGIWS